MHDTSDTIPVSNPLATFNAWFAEAQHTEPNDPNAMCLATATPQGAPSARMVLLKDHDDRGFVFYTNGQSRKGEEIRANAQAALLFHWKSLRRQVRVEGSLEEVSTDEADAYFHSRAFVSQVGSAASDQSRPLDDRDVYLNRVAQLKAVYKEAGEVPRPPHWTGFRLAPRAIELWSDRPNRLHERRRFVRNGNEWQSGLLYP